MPLFDIDENTATLGPALEGTPPVPDGDIPDNVFDPEGQGYDSDTAQEFINANPLTIEKPKNYKGDYITQDGAYQAWVWHPDIQEYKRHSGSLNPKTGMVLKGRQHPTWDLMVEEERRLGNSVLKGNNGRYFSKKAYRASYDNDVWDANIPEQDRQFLSGAVGKERYEEEGKKTINAGYFADLYDIDEDIAYDLHDQLGEGLFDIKGTPTTFYERIKNRWRSGKTSVEYMDAGWDIINDVIKGNTDDLQSKVDAAEKLNQQRNIDEEAASRNLLEQMIGETTEQLPFTIEAGKAGAAFGALGLGIGAVVETGLKVPGVAKFGLKGGAAVGAGGRTAQLEAGGMFLELMQIENEKGEKIDPQIAMAVSLGVGAINGTVEVGEWAVLLSTFGIGTKVFGKAAETVSKRLMAAGTFRQIALKYGLKFGGQLSAETLQEIVQETSNIIGAELAKELTNRYKGTEFEVAFQNEAFAEEVTGRLMQIGNQSLKGFPLLLLPGTAVSFTHEAIKSKVKAVGTKPPQAAVAAPVAEPTPKGVTGQEAPTTPTAKPEGAVEEVAAPVVEKQKEEAVAVEQAVEEEELSLEDTAAIKRLEAEVAAEDAEVVSPKLHIGNVTKRMKKVFAAIFNRQPEDIQGFTEEGFPTKKAAIEMTRGEAGAYLEFLEVDLQDRLDNNKIRTENDLAQANADWGDIKAVREVLGKKIGARPFTVKRKGKIKTKTIKGKEIQFEERLRDLTKKKLQEMANGYGVSSEGTKATIIDSIEQSEGYNAAREVSSEQTKAADASLQIIATTKELVKESIRPTEDANMTIGQVLGNTMKRMAQAARTAFSKGNKEGIAKVRAQLREAKERLRFKKSLERRVRQLVKRIAKPAGKDIEGFYRNAIALLQSEFDPKTRSTNAKRKIQKRRDFLKRATPEQLKKFPEKLMMKLAKRNYEDYTVAELEELAEQVELLRTLGKTKQTLLKQQADKKHDDTVRDVVENITGSPDMPDQGPHSYNTDKEGKITSLLGLHLQALRIPRILDWLDGKKGTFKGLLHRLFYDKTNEQYNAELRERDRRNKALEAKQKELGITTAELAQGVEVSDIVPGLRPLLIEEIMGIYTALKNNLSLDALIHGNKITEAQALAIISNLEGKYKQLADFVMEDYADNYARLRDAHIAFTDDDLGSEGNYTPIVRLLQNEQVSVDEIEKQLQQRAALKRGYEQKGFTKDRKNISAEHQQKMDLRLVSVWHGQIAKQEHYIHFASHTKDMRAFMADPKMRQAITNKLGQEGVDVINKWIDRVANPNIYKGLSGLERYSRVMRGNVALAYLAYNLTTIAKQIPSVLLYMADAGPQAMITSLTEFMSDPKKMIAFVREKDPQVQHVHLEREIEELRLANATAHAKILKRVGRAGMKGIMFTDGLVRTIGWNAVYQKQKDLGASDAEATREAQNVTLRTQPAAHAKDVANLYASNEYLNWFTMFTSQLNQIYNIVTYDTYASWDSKNYQMAAARMLGVALNATAIWAIANKQLPDDEDDLLDAATEGFLSMIPLIGKSLMSAKKGYGSVELPLFALTKDVVSIGTAKDKEKAAIRAMESLGAIIGAPVVGIRRTAKFLKSGNPEDLFGGPKEEKKAKKRIR